MKRNTLNLLIDLLLTVDALGMIFTALILYYVLPPRSGGNTFWAWERHDWGSLHFWLSVGLVGLFLVHVVLHWQWVCGTILSVCRSRTRDDSPANRTARNLVGIILLAVVVLFFAGFVWIAPDAVDRTNQGHAHEDLDAHGPGEGHPPPGKGRQMKGGVVRGSMTLADVTDEYGIPLELLREQLGLPEGVSPQQRLGHLRKQYGFTMSQVREVIRRHAQAPATKE